MKLNVYHETEYKYIEAIVKPKGKSVDLGNNLYYRVQYENEEVLITIPKKYEPEQIVELVSIAIAQMIEEKAEKSIVQVIKRFFGM